MTPAEKMDCDPVAVRPALLVGGNSEIETLLSDTLKSGDGVIAHAPNHAAVLAMVQEKPFDLILPDEKTSGADDVELLRKIRLVRPTHD